MTYFYLMKDSRCYKYGITNNYNQKIKQHQKELPSFDFCKVAEFVDLATAKRFENLTRQMFIHYADYTYLTPDHKPYLGIITINDETTKHFDALMPVAEPNDTPTSWISSKQLAENMCRRHKNILQDLEMFKDIFKSATGIDFKYREVPEQNEYNKQYYRVIYVNKLHAQIFRAYRDLNYLSELLL